MLTANTSYDSYTLLPFSHYSETNPQYMPCSFTFFPGPFIMFSCVEDNVEACLLLMSSTDVSGDINFSVHHACIPRYGSLSKPRGKPVI